MLLSAPGKLFLTGEYAVLWGAPAALAAVRPRLSAVVEPREQGIALRVPGASVRAERTDGALHWTGTPAAAKFAMAALELALASRADAPNFAVRFAPSPRNSRGRKLGLGTSAAAAVIAAAAGLTAGREAPRLDPDLVFPIAAQAHWQVQGRRGSNGDVAAACYGGLIRYERYPVEAAERPARPAVEPLPDRGLRLALVFSGVSAKTPSMVAAVEAALSADERAEFVNRSSALTEAFCAALRDDRRESALAALNDAGDLLEQLGKRAGVSVVTPKLARIQALGRARGLAAKVSGAGGGDGAIFAGFDSRALKAALAEVRRAGFDTVEVALSSGVQIDPAQKASGYPPRSQTAATTVSRSAAKSRGTKA